MANVLESITSLGYQIGEMNSRFGSGKDIVLYLHEPGSKRNNVVSAKTMAELTDYVTDNYSELIDILEDYMTSIDDTEITATAYDEEGTVYETDLTEYDEDTEEEDTEFFCEDCDTPMEVVGVDNNSLPIAWCPNCQEYKAVY